MSKCTNRFNNNSYGADITNDDKDNYYVELENSHSNLPNLINKGKERASSSSLRSVCHDNSNKECNHRSGNHSNNYRSHISNGIQKNKYHKGKEKSRYNMNYITRYEFEKENQSPDSDVRMRYKQDSHVKGFRYRDLMEKAKESCGAHMGRLKF
jgi:hypothetical protein